MDVPIVTTLDELRRVTHVPLSRSLLRAHTPVLKLPNATELELERWQRRLRREMTACGCTSGALAMFGSLVALVSAQFLLGVNLGSGLEPIGIWVAVVLCAAVVGKTAGLLRAQRRRRRLYTEIEHALIPRTR